MRPNGRCSFSGNPPQAGLRCACGHTPGMPWPKRCKKAGPLALRKAKAVQGQNRLELGGHHRGAL